MNTSDKRIQDFSAQIASNIAECVRKEQDKLVLLILKLKGEQSLAKIAQTAGLTKDATEECLGRLNFDAMVAPVGRDHWRLV